jgi:hypothetical protein
MLALPMMSQDYMNIYFKNGTYKKIQLNNVIELSNSSYDSDGNSHGDIQYQHILTKYNEHIYNIAEVDSITFTKCSENEVKNNMVSTINTIFPILNTTETIEGVETQLESIKQSHGIENAWIDDNTLYVQIKDGEIVSFSYPDSQEYKEDDEVDAARTRHLLESIRTKVNMISSTGNKNLRVAIVNQTKNDNGPSFIRMRNRIHEIELFLIDLGIIPIIEDPTLDFYYSGMYNYDLIILFTHGGIRKQGSEYERDKDGDPIHTYLTSNEVGEYFSIHDVVNGDEIVDEWINKRDELIENTIYEKARDDENVGLRVSWHREIRGVTPTWVAYIQIPENFFKYYSKGTFHDNSIIFAGVCHSLQESHSLAKKLHDNNLGYYLGYTDEALTYTARNAAKEFVGNLLTGKSVQKSRTDLPNHYKTDINTNAKLELSEKNEGNIMFLFPTITNEISPSVANKQYAENHYVEVEGSTRTMNPDGITIGFIYGTGENFVVDKHVTDVTLTPKEDGYYNFKGKLTDIEIDKTYFYRAYTYDDENYNFGERYSFKIEKQQDDFNKELMISRQVDGVDYKVYKKIIDKSDYHENPDGWKCYRSQLILETSKGGKNNSTVIDDQIYLDDSKGHHGGQTPCMLLDYNTNHMYVFCNSKDADYQYSMEGYAYVSPMDNVNFQKETVFTYANFGWYPYFRDLGDGSVTVDFFSFAGYYALRAIRQPNGSWDLYVGGQIYPEDYAAMQAKNPAILVIGK